MEAGDGLVEGVGGVVRQQALEPAKSPAGGGKELGGVRRLVADGALHEGIDPPGALLAVGVVVLAVFGPDDLHGLPAPVAVVLLNLPA